MMLPAVTRKINRGQSVRTKEFPPPTKGWISRDNIATGGMGTALILDNFFPLPDAIRARAGYAQAYDTGETADVETVMGWHGPNGTNTVFSVCNGTIYQGASATSVTGLTNSRWQHVMFSTSGGNFLYAVNGADTAKYYNGTSWATSTTTTTTSDNFAHVFVYKSRLYFAVKDTLKFAYLPVVSIAGAAATFDLGQVMNKGGYLMAGGTLTRDGGSGPDDYAVFVSSEGQAAIYSGSDPSDANDWSLVGVYNLPRPMGRRCLFRAAGDLYLITEAGVIPVTKAINLAESVAGTVAVTQNISNAMNEVAKRYKGNFGWQLMEYSEGPMAILNVPISASVSHQYVMNTQTGAWCRFTGMHAHCWEVVGGDLYFGGDTGKVYKYGDAASDNGDPIVCDMKLAFDGFGSETRIKRWSMIRTVILSDGTTRPALGLDVDFSDSVPTGTVDLANVNVATWDNANWDNFTWSSGQTFYKAWRNLTENPGYTAAIRMRAEVNGTGAPVLLQVNGFNLAYEMGGVL